MTTDQLRSWMEGAGRNREWLSDKIGASKRTIDNWFALEEIPEMAQRLISRIINEEMTSSLRFTPQEWEAITSAMKLAGYDDYYEYVRNTIVEVSKDPSKIPKKER